MKNNSKFLAIFLIALLCHVQKVFSQTTTYLYTGAPQTFTVPVGVTSIGIDAVGAMGGQYSVLRGGYGGRVQCTMNVTPLTVYYIYVGGAGATGIAGWNGGGSTALNAGGGGGGTDMRTVLGPPTATNRPVVAGGGGGGTANYGVANYDRGGNGGGLVGEQGYTDNVHATGGQTGGGGGSTVGGTAGTYPTYPSAFPGTVGVGGNGAPGTYGTGGGGGFYGGGGGSWTGGGGGSSYTDPVAVTAFSHTQGYNTTGDGKLIITVLCTTPVSGTIVGPPVVCQGSNVTLSDPTGTTGGTWSSTNTFVATIDSVSGVVTGVSSGPVTISYSIVLSCGTATATTSLFVNPLPLAIGGPTNVCVGSSISLSDGTTGGTWTSSNTFVANAVPSSGLVTGLIQGTSTISYTLATGCNVSSVISANLAPGLTSGPSSVCMGSTITMSNPATGGTWNSSNNSVATVDPIGGLVTPASPGSTLISYSNGCGPAAVTPVVVNPLPAAIAGVTSLCITASSSLTDATSGGMWSSTLTSTVTVGSLSGLITGVAAGSATVSYTLPTTCAVGTLITVIPPLAPISGPPVVCQGSTIGLGGLPTGGSWVSGTPGIATVGPFSGIVSGVSMGTTVITYTAGIGCSATRIITVDPSAPILGRDSVCAGLTTFLTDIVGGGEWSTSNASVATTEVDSGRVTGVGPGTVTVIYLLPTGCSRSTTFSVINFPNAITGTTKTCPGSVTSLADAAPAGGIWTSNNPGVATVTPSGTVAGVSADTVGINYTILPGCVVSTVVTVNPLPAVIIGQTPVCPGIIDSLHDATPRGLWSSSTPSLATVIDTSGVLSTLGAGPAIIKYTLPTGCYRTKTISIDPIPVPTLSYDAFSNTIYADSMFGFVSYQWYDSIQGLIVGANATSLAALYNEYYYVVVTDTNGCKGASSFIHYTPSELGIDGTKNNTAIKIYPNPVSGVLHITSTMKLRAVVSSVDGRTEIEQKETDEVDVSHLADGVYLIRLYDESGQLQSTQKFSKE